MTWKGDEFGEGNAVLGKPALVKQVTVRTYPAGRTLEGSFRDGKVHNGNGMLRHATGTVDEGQWVAGKLTGQSKKTHPDGLTLEGEFREGRIYNGRGTLVHPNGETEEGQWVEGKLTGLCKVCSGGRFRGSKSVPGKYRYCDPTKASSQGSAGRPTRTSKLMGKLMGACK
jgi:hypothetical protein